MTIDRSLDPSGRTPEQRAQDAVQRIASQAEPIPLTQGGGHRLDMQVLYEEIVAALRETVDDIAFCTDTKPNH
ncbi:hypothetical protein [Roseibium alexandrii]|jgi:hypothetical protein|uniref:Uncharacterized protein n=1 Tax=Roseibium alexandrii (strain DSM 17067 / NCIMB 14079 / DFL-11) TaxID=244592 RepID=A0A5E8H243_ROSAD|nr:hypothetical protein [Roseibium alexandrii]EEE46004.1 hypothetical protein SADFL11_3293 [Roseibium alexandrii DFL-11]